MSDLEKYITKRKVIDKKFSANFEEGYKDFEVSVILKQLRKESGLTQKDLAEKLHTKKTAISRIENQGKDIKVSTLFKIAKALHKQVVINFCDLDKGYI